MTVARTLYACQTCGYQSSKWLGRCPECGAWSSFVEEVVETAKKGARAARAGAGGSVLVPLGEVEQDRVLRVPCDMPALDRVLGGGVGARRGPEVELLDQLRAARLRSETRLLETVRDGH